LSSLAITNPNWYTNVTGSSETPFVTTYVPTENEAHVTLTEGNVTFALNEILNPPLTLEQPELLKNITVKNPVRNSVEIFSPSTISNASISIVDASGKKVFVQKSVTFEGNFQIPINLMNGFYFIKIESTEKSIIHKLIKN
jgi:hypothetical protein